MSCSLVLTNPFAFEPTWCYFHTEATKLIITHPEFADALHRLENDSKLWTEDPAIEMNRVRLSKVIKVYKAAKEVFTAHSF